MKKSGSNISINIKYKSHVKKNGENEGQAEMNSAWVQLIGNFLMFPIENLATSLSSDVKT